MKIVIHTQDRENYAAHTGFDGSYRWKYKGGDTYILEGVTVEQAQDGDLWRLLTNAIERRDDYFETYILSMDLVDDCVPNSEFCEEWEVPRIMMYRGDGSFAVKSIRNCENVPELLEQRETWVLRDGLVEDYLCIFERKDGALCDWQGNILEAA